MTDVLLQKPHHDLDNRYVSLSEEIRRLLVDAFIEGQLIPGTRVNDIELAKKLGVSRTPVREALRGLQTMGLIETLPARITRVATLTTEEFEHTKTVWASLYKLLLTDSIDKVTDAHIKAMTKLCQELAHNDDHAAATTSFRFFDTLTTLTNNTFLQQNIHQAACKMRLGHRNETEHTHFRITFAQAQHFLSALINKNDKDAHNALDSVISTAGATAS